MCVCSFRPSPPRLFSQSAPRTRVVRGEGGGGRDCGLRGGGGDRRRGVKREDKEGRRMREEEGKKMDINRKMKERGRENMHVFDMGKEEEGRRWEGNGLEEGRGRERGRRTVWRGKKIKEGSL